MAAFFVAFFGAFFAAFFAVFFGALLRAVVFVAAFFIAFAIFWSLLDVASRFERAASGLTKLSSFAFRARRPHAHTMRSRLPYRRIRRRRGARDVERTEEPTSKHARKRRRFMRVLHAGARPAAPNGGAARRGPNAKTV
ncbi:MAG: hypothetical protein HZY79_14185 [Rhodoblastus sp.]|nr:MAG: hypothetical protein HZY79_14185 [Rhodoblastus sp.]